jgi:hypothetical protein
MQYLLLKLIDAGDVAAPLHKVPSLPDVEYYCMEMVSLHKGLQSFLIAYDTYLSVDPVSPSLHFIF